jgi:hypothetical protein
MSQITLNLLLKTQSDMKNGINWLKCIIEKGVKFEFQNAINIISNEFSIKVSIMQGVVNNDMMKIRKTFEIG